MNHCFIIDHSPGEREYRSLVTSEGLFCFTATVKESDLFISAEKDLSSEALKSLLKFRAHLESYGAFHADFLTTLAPMPDDPLAPSIVRSMIKASHTANVGPMAAVAGAVAEYVGKDLAPLVSNLIIENGGDIYFNLLDREGRVAIFAGASPLSYKVHLTIKPIRTPLAVCTSSATVGPSISFGKADAVTVLSTSGALADAAATALCNMVRHKNDIKKTLDYASAIEGVRGAVIVVDDVLGAWGEVELS